MRIEPGGPQASRLRQRKFELVRRFHLPDDLLPGSLSLSHLRCGKPTCHCAEGPRHPVWSLTFMVRGKKHVQHIPKEWVEDVRRRVEAGRAFQDAVREVLAANAQLLALARQQRRKARRKGRRPVAGGGTRASVCAWSPTYDSRAMAEPSRAFRPRRCSGLC